MQMEEDFLLEIHRALQEDLEAYVDTLKSDHSEWVYVDGEEGDYGRIKYTDPVDGKLIACFVSLGGDQDNFEFTKWGRGMFLAKLEAKVRELSLENDKKQE